MTDGYDNDGAQPPTPAGLDGDPTRIERRRPSFAPWVRPLFRTGWVIIAMLFLFIMAGADLAEVLNAGVNDE